MLNTVSEAAKLALIPAAVLYLLGFLCVTAYLSRFGIINFEIVNARYLIAGLFPFFGIGASAALCFFFRQKIIDLELISLRRSSQRQLFYALFLGSIYSIGAVLNSILSFGRYREPDRVATIKDYPLGKYDLAGRFLEHVSFSQDSDVGAIVRITIHVAAYLLALVLIVWAATVLLRIVRAHRRKDLEVADQVATAVSASQSEAGDEKTTIPLITRVLIAVVESLFWSLGVVIFFYAQRRLGSALIDFSSFSQPMELTSGLTFSWFFLLVLATFLVIGLLPRDIKRALDSEEIKKLIHPDAMWNLGYIVLIPLLTSSFAFGAAIFPRVSFAIGGGEPREVLLKLSDGSQDIGQSRIFLLGESSQFVYAVVVGSAEARALQINKDSITYIETKRRVKPHLGPPW